MYVVTEKCRGCLNLKCVTNCPASCFHTDGEQVFIDPNACIECGECEYMCPVGAIITDYPTAPAGYAAALEVNARRSKETPNLDAPTESLTPSEAKILEPVLFKLTGKTAAQRRAEEKARAAEQRRRDRKREESRKRWEKERAEKNRRWAKRAPALEHELEIAMTKVEALRGTEDERLKELILAVTTQLTGFLQEAEDRVGFTADEDDEFDDDDDEMDLDDEVFEKAWFVLRRYLDEMQALGADLRLEQDDTEFLEVAGYSFTGVTKRRLYAGEHLLFAWRQGVVGEGQQMGTGLWLFEPEPEAEPGSTIPPASLLHRTGLQMGHPGFPTDYWEGLKWAGIDDDDE